MVACFSGDAEEHDEGGQRPHPNRGLFRGRRGGQKYVGKTAHRRLAQHREWSSLWKPRDKFLIQVWVRPEACDPSSEVALGGNQIWRLRKRSSPIRTRSKPSLRVMPCRHFNSTESSIYHAKSSHLVTSRIAGRVLSPSVRPPAVGFAHDGSPRRRRARDARAAGPLLRSSGVST